MTEVDESNFKTTNIHSNVYIVDYRGPDQTERVKFFRDENEAIIFAKQQGAGTKITQRQDLQHERPLPGWSQ